MSIHSCSRRRPPLRAGRKPHPTSTINGRRSSTVPARSALISGGASSGHRARQRRRMSSVVSGRATGYLVGVSVRLPFPQSRSLTNHSLPLYSRLQPNQVSLLLGAHNHTTFTHCAIPSWDHIRLCASTGHVAQPHGLGDPRGVQDDNLSPARVHVFVLNPA